MGFKIKNVGHMMMMMIIMINLRSFQRQEIKQWASSTYLVQIIHWRGSRAVRGEVEKHNGEDREGQERQERSCRQERSERERRCCCSQTQKC
jgi:hypothetical protein